MTDNLDLVDKFNRWTPGDLKERVARLERVASHVPTIFHHLFAMLPPPGEDFPAEKRLAFLRAAADIADLAYGTAPISIRIEEPQS